MKFENIIKLVLFVFSIVGIVFFAFGLDFGQSNRFEDLFIEAEAYEEIKENRTHITEDTHPEIQFDGQSLNFDSLNGFYLYSLIDDNANRFNPVVKTLSHELTQYDVALSGEAITEKSLNENDSVQILLYTDSNYKEYTLKMTDLPVVNINLDQSPEDPTHPIGDLDASAQFSLFDNRKDVPSAERLIESQSYIRLRGASSRMHPKKQFRLNLREFSIGASESNNHLSLLDMRKDDDWILYAAYNDPEKIRNTFSNNLWYEFAADNNPLGIVNGTQGKIVEVFIDDMYWGVYTLMHPIDDKQLELSTTNDPETSELYYRTVSNVPFDKEQMIASENHLVNGRFEFRDPEPFYDPKQWDPIIRHMSMLTASEKELRSYLNEEVYLENLIDYYLFLNLSQASDNDKKNHNYISKISDGQRMMLESPWDLDLTWGLQWTPESEFLSVVRRDPAVNFIPSVSLITHAVDLNMEDVIKKIEQRYDELRNSDWETNNLLNTLSSYEEQIYGSGAMLREHERWPDSAYTENAEELKDYVETRLIYLDQFIETLGRKETPNE
ncbi:CotH kinase family protein [Marinilactibacillus piezotolerans]|uniref:CotH kinase family protein n=1 Tax=Marinilactibacillus piezotolerans TaxID=258723 RepID=UPI0015C442AB|nr:CotH kinase family protein [Marinilactibacillus piezotolerans]